MTATQKPAPRSAIDAPDDLEAALLALVRHPVITLGRTWSWKAAAISALLRASLFFATNLHAGTHKALHAMMVEALFAVFAAGTMGAVSQQLRNANPVWATGAIVWFAMPAIMLLLQLTVHRTAGTPHVTLGLIASFCFAAVASAFSWYAMRHGALLGGSDSTTLENDAKALPGIVLGFVVAPFRILRRRL